MASIKNILKDLTHLEVSTIVKDHTIGAHMPNNNRVLLLDIADLYRLLLKKYDLSCVELQPSNLPHLYRSKWRYGGEYSFREIKIMTARGIEIIEKKLLKIISEEEKKELNKHLSLLSRLHRQSANIINMFKARKSNYITPETQNQEGYASQANFQTKQGTDIYISQIDSKIWNNDLSITDIHRIEDLDLDGEELNLIQKTWSLGTEEILLKTTIQIDGDLMTYMTKDFLNYEPNKQKILLHIHNNSLLSATKMWNSLLIALKTLGTDLVSQVFSKKKAK